MRHVVTHEGNGNAYIIFVRNHLGKRPLKRHRHRKVKVCPIKMENEEIWSKVTNWVQLAKDGVKW
jgi:hypothetical protein